MTFWPRRAVAKGIVAEQGMVSAIVAYVEVLKPRETALLVFIGAASAVVASGGRPASSTFIWAVVAILLGSAGCNGLTNFLDREVDARMQRTRHRALPSRRIYPAYKVLPLVLGLVALALGTVWYLNPMAFVAGLAGTLAAVMGRKMAVTHVLGGVSGLAPVLVGWLAVESEVTWVLLGMSLLTVVWVPLHVWSLMMAYREDYLQAGVRMFPVTSSPASVYWLFLALSLLLYALSWALYFVAGFGPVYLAIANILGVALVYANLRLLRSGSGQDSRKLYKLSTYPYLGLLFLTMALAAWLGPVWGMV